MKTNRTSTIITFVTSVIIVAVAALVFLNRQYIIDSYTVWTYEPSNAIQTLQKNSELTDKGTFIFYATKPEVEKQEAFNEECPRQEAGSPILGCYTNDDRIYIYDLTNEKLDGMEEVTAVHEMLHAAWRRMSTSDQEKMSKELKAAYNTITDAELKTRMEYYERTEPGEFYNELHSILGTEQESLSDELEEYYAEYFDRATVLALHAGYSDLYKSLYARADELYTQMQTLSASIESSSSAYNENAAQYSQDVQSFNSRAANGQFSSQAQFNNERTALVVRSSTLNKQRQAINASIVTYNAYYAEYQDISKQVEVLNESIDSFHQIDQAPSV